RDLVCFVCFVDNPSESIRLSLLAHVPNLDFRKRGIEACRLQKNSARGSLRPSPSSRAFHNLGEAGKTWGELCRISSKVVCWKSALATFSAPAGSEKIRMEERVMERSRGASTKAT